MAPLFFYWLTFVYQPYLHVPRPREISSPPMSIGEFPDEVWWCSPPPSCRVCCGAGRNIKLYCHVKIQHNAKGFAKDTWRSSSVKRQPQFQHSETSMQPYSSCSRSRSLSGTIQKLTLTFLAGSICTLIWPVLSVPLDFFSLSEPLPLPLLPPLPPPVELPPLASVPFFILFKMGAKTDFLRAGLTKCNFFPSSGRDREKKWRKKRKLNIRYTYKEREGKTCIHRHKGGMNKLWYFEDMYRRDNHQYLMVDPKKT